MGGGSKPLSDSIILPVVRVMLEWYKHGDDDTQLRCEMLSELPNGMTDSQVLELIAITAEHFRSLGTKGGVYGRP